MDNNIYINGIKMPTLPRDGLSLSREPIWSANSGRTADCAFVGDIIGMKWNGSLNWGRLSFSDVKIIRGAVSTINSSFFTLAFTDDTGTRQNIRCYSTSPKSVIHVYKNNSGEVESVSVDIVEV